MADASTVEHRGIGDPVPRVEDLRLLTGRGRYSDDRNLLGQVFAFVVRSPHAHARLRSINMRAACAASGVIAVLTGADWLADGLAPMPAWGNPKDVELKNRDGRPVFYTPLYPVVTDKIRRVGEPVAVVIAETAAQARDAAELVDVDYDVLPAVAESEDALKPGAPQVWDEVPGNLSVDDEKGDGAVVDVAFARAAHIQRMTFHNNRVTGVPMEPRAAVADYDLGTDRLTLYAGGQGVNRFQLELCQTFKLPKEKIRVVSEDVGGGYGTRNHLYIEFVLVLWAARRLRRPVKWTCERGEAFVSDYSGRDLVTRAALAFDADGRILALRTENIANIGSHTVSFVPIARGPTVGNGVYRVPSMHVLTRIAFTNTLPVVSYRGAGRPESMFVIERLLDEAAVALGIDRIELRRRNIIPSSAMPYRNAVGVIYDSGDYPKSMAMVLQLANWDGFAKRRSAARVRGRLAGIGLCNYIETATGYPQERGEMTVRGDGIVDLVMGTQSSGQGHETSYAQVIAGWLGVPFESVRLRTGDTDFVSVGSGSHSSRSMRLAGYLYRQTADAIIERGRQIAAHLLEAAATDIDFTGGRFAVAGTDRSIGLFEVAVAAETGDDLPEALRGRLTAAADIAEPLPAYPNGCHVAEVEIEPDTGVVHIVGYWGVDDVGTVINPMIVDGQTHGGIAQGAGQALMELCVHDPQSAQVIAGSFMDYAMPRADLFPPFRLAFNEVPAPSTRLGVKGGGEGGTTGAPPALINAIVDALRDLGVTDLQMPATSERIWRAMRGTKAL